MALNHKVGLAAANTGSTSTVVTGLGFQPKAIIFTVVSKTTDDETLTAQNVMFSRGFSNGTNHRAVGWAATNAVSTSDTRRALYGSRCIALPNVGGGLVNSATVAFDSDGFTLTWISTPAAAYRIMYEAFGGTEITNVAVGHITGLTGGAANHDVNVGFVGNIAFFLSAGCTSTVDDQVGANIGFGVAVSSSKRWAAAIAGGADAQTMAANVNAQSYVRDDLCLAGLVASSGLTTGQELMTFGSFDQGGLGTTMRFTQTSLFLSSYLVPYMVIKGGQWDCGVFQKTGGGGAQSISSMAFQPTLLGLAATKATALATITSDGSSFFGATDGTNEATAGAHSVDTISTSTSQRASSTKVFGTQNDSADFTSFNSNGFTISWTNGLSSTNQVGWYAGAAVGGGGPPTHLGETALTASIALAAGGVSTLAGASAITGSATLNPTATVPVVHQAAAALAATLGLTVAGRVTQVGAAALATSITVSPAGLRQTLGAAALSLAGTLTATGYLQLSAATAITGGVGLAVAGLREARAAADLASSITLTAEPATGAFRLGEATLPASVALAALAQQQHRATAAAVAAITLASAATRTAGATAALSLAITLTSAGQHTQAAAAVHPMTVNLVAAGTLGAAGTTHEGTATLDATATLAAGAAMSKNAAAALAVVVGLSARPIVPPVITVTGGGAGDTVTISWTNSQPAASGYYLMVGEGGVGGSVFEGDDASPTTLYLPASGWDIYIAVAFFIPGIGWHDTEEKGMPVVIIPGAYRQGAATLHGAGTVVASGSFRQEATASLVGSVALAASASSTKFGAVAASLAITLSANAAMAKNAAAVIPTTITLASAGSQTRAAAAALALSITLSPTPGGVQIAEATLTAAITRAALGQLTHGAAAALALAITLSPNATRVLLAASVLATSGALAAAGSQTHAALAAQAVASTLSTTATVTAPSASAALNVSILLAALARHTQAGAAALPVTASLSGTATMNATHFAAAALFLAITLAANGTVPRIIDAETPPAGTGRWDEHMLPAGTGREERIPAGVGFYAQRPPAGTGVEVDA